MLLSDDGGPLYKDSNHLSRRGALKVAPAFAEVFELGDSGG
jgi:hypothetical protein